MLSSDPPTALVALNDLLAIGAIDAARSRSIDVPSDLSIVGFDDIYAARHTDPPLTTLRHQTPAIGRQLIRQLLRAIDEVQAIRHVYLTPELVVRGSTAPVGS